MQPKDIITFWFETLTPKQWWVKDTELDEQIRTQFFDVYQLGAQEKLHHWQSSDLGRLAEIIVLDQFPRNMFRELPNAFETDALALQRTNAAIEAGTHKRLQPAQINFLLMPFMHCESLKVHQEAWPLFEQYTTKNTQNFELKHQEIIKRFGRYPHRNKILGRTSTPKEKTFLNQPNSSF